MAEGVVMDDFFFFLSGGVLLGGCQESQYGISD